MRVLEFSIAADLPLAAALERSAEQFAARTALLSDVWQPTYAELNATANRIAHALIAGGISVGDRVAILMAPETPSVAATLAVWKAGAILVRLDANHPPARLRELVADCDPAALITDAGYQALASEIASGRVLVRVEDVDPMGPSGNPGVPVVPEQTAVLVYTSGSTGRPKGVMATHRQIRLQCLVGSQVMNDVADDRVAVFGSLGAGDSTVSLVRILSSGAMVCAFPVAVRGVTGLADWIIDNGITVISCQTAVFRRLVTSLPEDFRFERVRSLRIGGEPVTSDDFRLFERHFPARSRMVVWLASNETGAIAWWQVSPGDAVPDGPLPVGWFAPSHQVSLLNDADQPVQPGQVGEIVLRSRYVAAGYWRNPVLTAERFTEVGDDVGTRILHTGDLGRINADGLLEFCGRKDDRLKIRGTRIEVREVLDPLELLPGVSRAMLEAIARDEQEPLLVAFVAVDSGHHWTGAALREALRATLPDPMVPSVFIIVDEWPLAPSGKVDRQALRDLYRRHQDAQERAQPIASPRTETEALLGKIWAELFEVPTVSRDADFFDLGGDSLMAMTVAIHVYQANGVTLELATLIDHPVLADLARAIDADSSNADGDDGPRPRPASQRPPPMSPWQERTYEECRRGAPSSDFMMHGVYSIDGPLDVELLRACIDEMERRHEILRTTFASKRWRGVQIIHPAQGVPLSYVDLRDVADPESEAIHICDAQLDEQVDLKRGPLLWFTLMRLGDERYWLLRSVHHILCDHMSWPIYLRELAALYEAALTGAPPPPPPLLQYADYAVWQRQRLAPGTRARADLIEWWRGKFANAPAFKPSFDAPRAPYDIADGIISWTFDPRAGQRLNVLAARNHATPLMARLAALAALLVAEAGKSEVLIGMYVNQRRHPALADMFGFFTNLMVLRLSPQFERTFNEWITTVRDETAVCDAHSGIPYEELYWPLRRKGVRVPAVKVLFHQGYAPLDLTFAGLRLANVQLPQTRPVWGFNMNLDELGGHGSNRCRFDVRLYDAAQVRAFVDRYARLLDIVSREPDRALGDLLAMSEATLTAAQ